MKAVRMHTRGGPELLLYEEAPKPAPSDGDALVRVDACAITPTELSWTETYTTRDGAERLPTIPGYEVSGVVEALGDSVAAPAVGEAVFGLTDFNRDGAAAEYVLVHADDLAPKPPSLSHVQASSVPLSALTAWQALFDHARLTQGQRVLIHAAAGGVGTYAVQLARWCGARVIATAGTENEGLVRELGADEFIDYTAAPFERQVRDVDVVLDTVGGETRDRSWGVIRRHGVLVTIVGTASPQDAARHHVRGVDFIVKPIRSQLLEIANLVEAGKVRPIVGAVYPLEKARQAFEDGLRGHGRGKRILQVRPG